MKTHYCPKCSGTKFHAHQLCRMDIIVDGNNNFYESASESTAADIYDSETPYGPYTCVTCGAEYDSLYELPATDSEGEEHSVKEEECGDPQGGTVNDYIQEQPGFPPDCETDREGIGTDEKLCEKSHQKKKKKKHPQRHKYLNNLGIRSTECCIFNTRGYRDAGKERKKRFQKQRKKYGFDERETWSLDYTLIGWLYSHLKMYLDLAIVDLTYHTFKIPYLVALKDDELTFAQGCQLPDRYYREEQKEATQEEAIRLACEYMEYYLKYGGACGESEYRAAEMGICSLKIVAEIFGALWW